MVRVLQFRSTGPKKEKNNKSHYFIIVSDTANMKKGEKSYNLGVISNLIDPKNLRESQ